MQQILKRLYKIHDLHGQVWDNPSYSQLYQARSLTFSTTYEGIYAVGHDDQPWNLCFNGFQGFN